MASYPLKSFVTLLVLNVGLMVFALSVSRSEQNGTFARGTEREQLAAVIETVAQNQRRVVTEVRTPRYIGAKTTATTTKSKPVIIETTKSVSKSEDEPAEKIVAKKIEKKPETKPKVVVPKVAVEKPVVVPKETAKPESVKVVPAPVPVKSAPVQEKIVPVVAPSNSVARIEQLVIEYMNNERRKEGLGNLSADTKLAKIARTHSADMLKNDFFSHTNKSGCDAECRIDNAGYSWWSYGENIHWMSGFTFTIEESAAKVVDDWMNSPGHRKNILGKGFTNVGVGLVMENDTFYTTANYSEPQ